MQILDFIFKGPPVPAVRMTRGTMWQPRAQNYLGYKNRLADALRSAFPELVIQDIPPVTLPKERNKFLKSRKNIRYKLLVRVNRDRDTGDIDNFCKTAMDALQGSGIVFNDKEIIWIDALVEKKMDCEEPSIRIVLEQI